MWSIYEMHDERERVSFRKVGEGLTKREAVKRMMGARKPKTAILKLGHSYYYWRKT